MRLVLTLALAGASVTVLVVLSHRSQYNFEPRPAHFDCGNHNHYYMERGDYQSAVDVCSSQGGLKNFDRTGPELREYMGPDDPDYHTSFCNDGVVIMIREATSLDAKNVCKHHGGFRGESVGEFGACTGNPKCTNPDK